MAVRAVAFPALAAINVVEIPLQIAEDNEIEQPVSIKVNPGRTRGPTARGDTGTLRHVGKCSVAIVVIKLVSAVSGYVQIFESIIVVISDGDSHSVTNSF